MFFIAVVLETPSCLLSVARIIDRLHKMVYSIIVWVVKNLDFTNVFTLLDLAIDVPHRNSTLCLYVSICGQLYCKPYVGEPCVNELDVTYSDDWYLRHITILFFESFSTTMLFIIMFLCK